MLAFAIRAQQEYGALVLQVDGSGKSQKNGRTVRGTFATRPLHYAWLRRPWSLCTVIDVAPRIPKIRRKSQRASAQWPATRAGRGAERGRRVVVHALPCVRRSIQDVHGRERQDCSHDHRSELCGPEGGQDGRRLQGGYHLQRCRASLPGSGREAQGQNEEPAVLVHVQGGRPTAAHVPHARQHEASLELALPLMGCYGGERRGRVVQ